MYPKRFEQLVAAFEKLPGVGSKTAQRYAFTMLEKDSEQIDEMVEALKGMYHVLGGLISSSKGIYPEDINIEKLLNRIDDSIKEVIVATSPTMDGEMTALYLDKVLKEKGVLVTRLAHGLPMGASLDYADDLTLIKALDNRRKIENE